MEGRAQARKRLGLKREARWLRTHLEQPPHPYPETQEQQLDDEEP